MPPLPTNQAPRRRSATPMFVGPLIYLSCVILVSYDPRTAANVLLTPTVASRLSAPPHSGPVAFAPARDDLEVLVPLAVRFQAIEGVQASLQRRCPLNTETETRRTGAEAEKKDSERRDVSNGGCVCARDAIAAERGAIVAEASDWASRGPSKPSVGEVEVMLAELGIADLGIGPHARGSVWSRVAGVITITNALALVAAVVLVAALWNVVVLLILPFVRLGALLWRLIRAVPAHVWERLSWLAAAQVVAASAILYDVNLRALVAFPACLAVPLLWIASARVHATGGGDEMLFIQMVSAFAAVAWSAIAVTLDTQIIGALTALAVTSLVGFRVHAYGLCYAFGFSRETLLSGTAASGAIVAATAVGVHSGWVEGASGPLRPFVWPTLLFVGIAFHVGALIVTSRVYLERKATSAAYLALNAVYTVWVVAVTFMASSSNLGPLQGVVGTLTCFWVLEKWIEIPPWNRDAFMTLGLAGFSAILYSSVLVMRAHPGWMLSVAASF